MTQADKQTFAPLARRDGEPVFDEPWQAQALGLAFSLAERGVYSPAQWSRKWGAAHRRLLSDGAADTPQTYYEAVVYALEGLLDETNACTSGIVEQRTQTWRRAYLNTPHGKPVQLETGRSAGSENQLPTD